MKQFSEMDLRRFPISNAANWSDYHIKHQSEEHCERECRQEGWNYRISERNSIRHHRMTIELAMPDKVKHV